jgi:methyl-accepting chemotaxis protein
LTALKGRALESALVESARESAHAYLVAQLAAELRELDAIVALARGRLAVDGAALDATTAEIRRQLAAVEKAREGAAVLEDASYAVADHAGALASIYERLPSVNATSIETLDALGARTRAVGDAFSAQAAVMAKLDADWKRIAEDVQGIASSGRRARNLAVNAAIEAAYVAEGGFGIVTDRMRALSAATLSAANDVHAIVRRNDALMRKAAGDITGARAAMDALLAELHAARESFQSATAQAGAFGDGVSRVAAIAEEQARTLPEIANAVQSLADLARSIAAAAAEDAHGAVAAGLNDATRTLAAREDIRDIAPPERPDARGDALAEWICAVADGAELARPTLEPGDSASYDAAAAVLARTIEDERIVMRGLGAAATATARTGVLWRTILKDVRAFGAQVQQLSMAITQSVDASRSLAGASREIAGDLDALDALCSSALAAFDRALDAVDEGHGLSADVTGSVAAMERATTEAEALLVQIGEVSADAGLLAINAAVEAARAGQRGLAFTVIADEIGRLASTTQSASDAVVGTILNLRGLSGELQAGSERQDAEMREVHDLAGAARATVDDARTAIGASVERGVTVGETSARVAASLAAVAREIAAVRDIAESASQPEVAAARIALVRLGDEALHVIERRRLGLPEERLRDGTLTLAHEVESALEELVAAGRTTVEAMTATDYRELRGDLVDRLATFFDVSDAPRDGFSPPKYGTSWDHIVDGALLRVVDGTMQTHPGAINACIFDLNGFAIAFPTQLANVRRSDGRVDWSRWGGKSFYIDDQTLHAARIGLGTEAVGIALDTDIDRLPQRMTRADFVARGIDLQVRTPRPWHVRTTILRGTRDVSRGASAPVYVGGIRIATVVLMERADPSTSSG